MPQDVPPMSLAETNFQCVRGRQSSTHNWGCCASERSLSLLWQPTSWRPDVQDFNTFVILMKSCKCNEHAEGKTVHVSSKQNCREISLYYYIWLFSDSTAKQYSVCCMYLTKLSSVPHKAGHIWAASCAQLFPELRWCLWACSVLSESMLAVMQHTMC